MTSNSPDPSELDRIYDEATDEMRMIMREILALEDRNMHLQQPQSMAEKIVYILDEYVAED